jgi:nitrogen regulatory protein PII
MKYLVAIIQSQKLQAVYEALCGLGITEMVAIEIHRYGREERHTQVYRGSAFEVPYLLKTRIEVAVADAMADRVVETVRAAASSGQIGDGRIFLLPVESSMQIRTGKVDADVIAL